MGLLSFFRKNKQKDVSDEGDFYSRAEDDSAAVRGKGRRKTAATASKSAQAIDPVLPEKKRARRRLVGAIALALAVVIVLPMVLDSEPKPLPDDISIQIPSKDQPARANRLPSPVIASSLTRKAPLEALDPAEEVIDPSPAAALAKTPAKNHAGKTAVDASSHLSKAGAKAADAAKTATDKPAQKSAATVTLDTAKERRAAQPAALASLEKTDDSRRAADILEARTGDAVAAKAAQPKGRFIVQVAALASPQKVSELRGRLSEAGIATYTQTVATESGDRIRIRIGPLANKEDADKMRAKLAKLGLNGTPVPN